MQISEELQAQLNSQIFLMANWKWMALICFLIAGFLLQGLFRALLNKFRKSDWIRSRSPQSLRYYLELKISKPISWLLTSLLWHAAMPVAELPEKFEKGLSTVLNVFIALIVIRLAYLGVEALGKVLNDAVTKTPSTLDDQLAPFVTKVLKVLVVIFGFLILLQNSGVNVMSLLAGLGLGGLALALAAQDTAANLFGSITILLDRPFQIGDFIKVAGTEGVVEEIGFRTTRIRTFYGSLISIPNSTMAKEQIDNMGARALRRIRHVVGLTCETPEKNMKDFCEHIRYYLQQHPKVHKEDITVRFQSMGDYSLNVLLNFHISATTGAEELELQEEFLYEVRRIAEQTKVGFAYPTNVQYSKN